MSEPATGEEAFLVMLTCGNCGERWRRQYPARTVVRPNERAKGVEVFDLDCESFGFGSCECCTVLECPTCEYVKQVEIADRWPVDGGPDDETLCGDETVPHEKTDKAIVEAISRLDEDALPDNPGNADYTDILMGRGITPLREMPANNRLRQMDSQDPALDSFYDDVVEAGHDTEITNPPRGCGHLKHNAAYVRSDVQALSTPDGDIPRFVTLDTPIEYREYAGRGAIIPGYMFFPGVKFGLAYQTDHTTTPTGEIDAHLSRLQSDALHGEHYGEITPARAHDLLMSVGESHWATPEAYIEECREHGLNLRIPASPNKQPPIVNPLRTRCWVVHPNGAGDGRAAIIGYAVLTRTIYTTGPDATSDDPDIPTYVNEWGQAGRVDLVTPGDPIPEDGDPDADIQDFTDEADPEADPEATETTAAESDS